MSRRFFRLLLWQPCFVSAYEQLSVPQSPVRTMLAVLKMSLLGTYFLLEATTLTNAMGVTNSDVLRKVQEEALKLWFYSIATSIALSIHDLLVIWTAPLSAASPEANSASGKDVESKHKGSGANTKEDTAKPGNSFGTTPMELKLFKQLALDLCDLTIPGGSLGWLAVDSVTVGTAGSISSSIAMRDIWKRVQS